MKTESEAVEYILNDFIQWERKCRANHLNIGERNVTLLDLYIEINHVDLNKAQYTRIKSGLNI